MMQHIKRIVASTPILGPAAKTILARLQWRPAFRNSAQYWEDRYRLGRNSGAGSYNRLAHFKADVLNSFVAENRIETVIEFGSGDGAQLALAEYPQYLGYDVSKTSISNCRARYAADKCKKFRLLKDIGEETAELTLSLDVIYHLVEDETFEAHMSHLFDTGTKFVGIYSSNYDEPGSAEHVRHRRFTDWVEKMRPQWALMQTVPNKYPYSKGDPENTSFADFYFYRRRS